uniref:Uncharacterized protein n=1 Tax=Solanum tuberosum TaxID=4113 RepID=M1DDN1_SOLTU
MRTHQGRPPSRAVVRTTTRGPTHDVGALARQLVPQAHKPKAFPRGAPRIVVPLVVLEVVARLLCATNHHA